MNPAARRAELQARCELQRDALARQVGDIEARLASTDRVLGSLRDVIARPSVLAGGAALLLTLGRSGWWSRLSRVAVLLATARRVYTAIKRQ